MRSNMLAAAMMIVSSACAMDRPADIAPSLPDDGDPTYRPVRGAVEGRLVGDVGPVDGIDGDAQLLSAYDDGTYLSVETVVQLEDRAVMTLLAVTNGALLFVPGLHATFTLENTGADDMQIALIGCVGQNIGVYDEFDAPADEVTVEVQAGQDDELLVAVRASWFDRDVTGARLATFNSAQTQFTLLR